MIRKKEGADKGLIDQRTPVPYHLVMQGQRQVLSQQQRLSLSPQLVQSIKLMAMPFADLRERILEEVEQNPALEVISDPFAHTRIPEYDASGPAQLPVSSGGGDEESDEHRDFIEGVLHREETLQEHLLSQLGECRLSPAVRSLAELIIQNLDHDGFHIAPLSELPGAQDGETLSKALETVRKLDPAGCATADFHESLLVQARSLKASHPNDELLDKTILILESHFETLEKGRPDALVKALKKKDAGIELDLDEAMEVFDLIRSLEPFPGRIFDHDGGSWVVPDVIVKKTEDDYSVVINEEEIPVIGLSPFFMEMEGDQAIQGEARDFARESIKEARWFMSTLQRRNLTILKLARALIVFQRDFFTHGPSRLAPLRMKDIADEIGLHEATVSRAANGKFLQCEWGIFEMKYFFSNQVGSSQKTPAGAYTSGRFSKQGVKEVVREIIESSAEPLSDQKIAEILASKGIQIARRTVAKYRGELTIKSSFERRV